MGCHRGKTGFYEVSVGFYFWVLNGFGFVLQDWVKMCFLVILLGSD